MWTESTPSIVTITISDFCLVLSDPGFNTGWRTRGETRCGIQFKARADSTGRNPKYPFFHMDITYYTYILTYLQ